MCGSANRCLWWTSYERGPLNNAKHKQCGIVADSEGRKYRRSLRYRLKRHRPGKYAVLEYAWRRKERRHRKFYCIFSVCTPQRNPIRKRMRNIAFQAINHGVGDWHEGRRMSRAKQLEKLAWEMRGDGGWFSAVLGDKQNWFRVDRPIFAVEVSN